MALMESYLVYRQKDWGMTSLPNDKVTLPENQWNLNKAKTCVHIMENLAKKKNLRAADDWVEFCQFLYEEEMRELDTFNKAWPFNRSHTLLDLIRAMRAYVILMIKDEITDCKITDITKLANTLTVKEDYLTQFFDTHIKLNDPKYKELGETDFNSFVNSVNNPDKDKQRKRTLCKSLFNTLHVPVPYARDIGLLSPNDVTVKAAAPIATGKSAFVPNSMFNKKGPPPAPRKSQRSKGAKRRMQFEFEEAPQSLKQSKSTTLRKP